MKRRLRTKKLIEPRLQLSFAILFAGLSGLGIIVQLLVLHSSMSKLAALLPNDRLLVMTQVPRLLSESLFLTFALLFPLTILVGILMTFRIVGPLYRFRVFLSEVIAGKRPADCVIRKGDELQDFCQMLNLATAPLRETQGEGLDAPRAPKAGDEAA
jgi:hypothetical protein